MENKKKEINGSGRINLNSSPSKKSNRVPESLRDGLPPDPLRARISDERALQRLSLFLYANDDAIDEMLHLIDDWERQTGRSLTPLTSIAPIQNLNGALSEKANRILRERECQYQVMPESLRHEPYVRILMALFIDSVEGVRTSSKCACLASGCPDTTALRYLDKLETEGLLVRVDCASDRRVTEIELTKAGLDLTRELLDQDCP